MLHTLVAHGTTLGSRLEGHLRQLLEGDAIDKAREPISLSGITFEFLLELIPILLQIDHKFVVPEDDHSSGKGVQINFSRVEKDVYIVRRRESCHRCRTHRP